MRAKEFITESEVDLKGKFPARVQKATRGAQIFTDTNFDRIYTLQRVMMAAASTDGKTAPDIDPESWIAKRNSAHPYSQADADKLDKAYKAVGIPHKDLNHGDLESGELNLVNSKSPIKPFKGYPR